MKIGTLLGMIATRMVDMVAGPPERVERNLQWHRNWRMPEKPEWVGYLTGRMSKHTGIPLFGKRPHWRVKWTGDRSKYMPNEIDRKKNRAARKAGLL